MSFRYKITPAVSEQIEEVLEQSEMLFGEAARIRYAVLIRTALADITVNPNRPGSRARPELGGGARSWHLRLSRERARTPTGIVNEPRHVIFYRVEADVVIIEHVLHEKQDARRHFAK